MKTERTDLSAVRKRLAVEVPASDVQAVFDRTLRELRREARIPGFRPGKAPLDVVRLRYGQGLPERVGERIVQKFTWEALRREGLEPIDETVHLEAGEGEGGPQPAREGEPYRFAVTFEVMPRVEPKDYVGLTVSKPAVEVTDEDVRRELEALRAARTKTVPVEGRPSRAGDLVEIDVEGAELGRAPVVPRSTRLVELGAKENPPEFERALSGRVAGDSFTFEVRFPDDHPDERLRGKVVYFKGSVRNVLQKEVPSLDDEFARSVGEGVETLEQLKGRIREALTRVREQEAERVARRRLLDMLLARNPFEVPGRLVERELQQRLAALGRELSARGLDPEKMDVDWDKVVEEQREEARRSVSERILLEAIARAEGIEPDPEEVRSAVAAIARETGQSPAALERKMKQDGRLAELTASLRQRRTLDWLYDKSHIS
ncbi:MAG: trigger factor [Acidobacteria bacterium]|nr:MAG: trigger factor [Acidobacteriota bacterium]